MQHNLYFEDVVIGAELETSARTVTRKDILTFAKITYDHHPLHTDDAFSREMGFDGIGIQRVGIESFHRSGFNSQDSIGADSTESGFNRSK